MKKTCLRVTALLLVIMMLALSLAGCNNSAGPDNGNGSSASESDTGRNGGNGSGGASSGADTSYGDFVYTASYQRINSDENIRNINRIVYGGGRLYMQAWINNGEKTVEYYDAEGMPVTDEEAIAAGEYEATYEYEETKAVLCSMNTDGSDFRILENFVETPLPEGSEGSNYIENICVDGEGNIWISEQVYAYHFDENDGYVDDGESFYLRRLDLTGAETANVDLSKLSADQDYFYIEYFNVDRDGLLYFTFENTLYVVGQDGAVQCKLEAANESWIASLVRLKDGTMGAVISGEDGRLLHPVDVAAKAFGEGKKLPANVWRFIDGGGDYDCYYNDNINLCGYRLDTEESVQLANWIDSDVNSNDLQNIIPLEDGRILGISYNYRGENVVYEIVTLTKADPATIPEKEILNFACMWLDYDVRAKIVDFNKTSDRYRIRVTDYSSFNTEDDYSAGQTKLTTEITSGQMPDILATNGLPVNRYISRGLLEDLVPYIESDPDLGPDALVPGVRRALSVDGGIYQAVSSFTVQTVIGASRIVGDKMGWTVRDLQAALAKMPAGCTAFNEMTRDSMLYYVSMMNQDDYVDWDAGTVDFNNQEFVNMLEFIKTFPVEIDWSIYEDGGWVSEYEKIRTGQVMLSFTTLGDFDEFRRYINFYDGPITFVGFPTTGGSGSIAQFNSGYAMSATCKNKDAAWSFLRYLFTEDYQSGDDGYYMWGYPTNQKAFDKVVERAMTKEMATDEDGNEYEVSRNSYWIDDNTSVELYAATQEEVDQILALIDNMESAATYDEEIAKIISEESQAFFEGQKSAQDVASVIQSRVWIYVNEQR